MPITDERKYVIAEVFLRALPGEQISVLVGKDAFDEIMSSFRLIQSRRGGMDEDTAMIIITDFVSIMRRLPQELGIDVDEFLEWLREFIPSVSLEGFDQAVQKFQK